MHQIKKLLCQKLFSSTSNQRKYNKTRISARYACLNSSSFRELAYLTHPSSFSKYFQPNQTPCVSSRHFLCLSPSICVWSRGTNKRGHLTYLNGIALYILVRFYIKYDFSCISNFSRTPYRNIWQQMDDNDGVRTKLKQEFLKPFLSNHQ